MIGASWSSGMTGEVNLTESGLQVMFAGLRPLEKTSESFGYQLGLVLYPPTGVFGTSVDRTNETFPFLQTAVI